MLVEPLLAQRGKWFTALVDSGSLVILSFPIIYYFSYRPMVRYIRLHQDAETELQKVLQGLEARIQERTDELTRMNQDLELEINQRKKAEEALSISYRRFQALIEHAPDGIALLGVDGKLRQITPSAEQILGYKPEEAEGQEPALMTHPDDLSNLLMLLNDSIQNPGKVMRAQYRFKHKDGSWRWLESTISNLLAEPGLQGLVFNYRDITEQKQTHEEILRLAKFPGENPNPVFRIAKDGHLIYANATSQPLLELWACKIGSEVPARLQEILSEVLNLGQPKEIEIECGEMLFSISFMPVPEAGYVNGYGRDITERKRVDEELRALNVELEQRVEKRTEELNKTNNELERANHAKDEFLANMSHELRTPLNSILGLSESLLEQRRDPLSERQQKSLQIIESSGHHLLEMINDVLDLAKIEAGKLDFYPELVGVDESSQAALAFVKNQAMKKSITITYAKEIHVAKIHADPRRLKQILINLLTNAVKFTPESGHITLQVHGNKEQELIQFSVIDTGIGIAAEDLSLLFQPFTQVEGSLNRQQEGTGLGLALVQRLTDLHGGSVHVESSLGKGSNFTINLPWRRDLIAQLETIHSRGEAPLQETNLSAQRPKKQGVILLVEDNMANILTIGEYIESHGYEVKVAHDGLEGIQLAEQINPDLILMDIQMPVMDGLEAMRRLRANPRFINTPIIALTAFAMNGDRERCLEAGANEYMSKPVSLKTLVKTIETFLGVRASVSQ